MNIWEITALLLLFTLIPTTIATIRGGALDRVTGMTLGGMIATLALIAIAIATGRSVYVDVAFVVALLSFAGGVAFARFLERWL